MAVANYKVEGLDELLRAAKAAGRETDTAVRKALKEAAEPVREEWSTLLWDYTSATGLRVKIKNKGEVRVEQGAAKTTGDHPEYGAYQLRRGERALADKQAETLQKFEEAVDEINNTFKKG